MNEDPSPPTSDPESQPNSGPQPASSADAISAKSQSDFRVGRVIMIVVPVFLILAGVVAFFALDGPTWVSNLLGPKLVVAQGSVFYKSSPLIDATITTEPVNGMPGALCQTDENGDFELVTDVNGGYRPGAYLGEHKVTVVVYELNPGPGSPGTKTPPLFASFSTTPLRIRITGNPDENKFHFRLDDYMEEGDQESSPVSQPQVGPGGGPPSAEDMIARIMGNDKDQDGSLSGEEIEAIQSERLRDGLGQADSNSDGRVDAAELKAMVENFLNRTPAGGEGRPAGQDAGDGERPAKDNGDDP